MKKQSLAHLRTFSLIGIGGLFPYAGFTQMIGKNSISRLQQDPLNVQVDGTLQSRGTSYGEAVIAMVYNYAYPQAPISEQEVIDYAAGHGVTRKISRLSPARRTR
jgi:hypothetical protein